jgi:outer membrane lipoprotein-sorting protein
VNILRRLPLSRLLLLCGVVAAVGIGATALAMALGAGPTPPPKPLADAVHDALSAPKVGGVSARIQLTDHLLEGASLAGSGTEGGGLASNPLIAGASGRLWIGSEGRARLELQSEEGDTQILYDGHSLSLYDAATNTLYRYTPPTGSGDAGSASASGGNSESAGSGAASHPYPGSACPPTCSNAPSHEVPTVAEIEEAIARASKHADISGATPSDVAGQAAYTVRVAPRENGGLIGGAELSWDATNGTPLRAAIYSTSSPSPVLELAVTEVSYGPVESSTLDFTPPASAKVREVAPPSEHGSGGSGSGDSGSGDSASGDSGSNAPASGASGSTADGSPPSDARPRVSTSGKGLGAIVLVESPVKAGSKETVPSGLEELPKVSIDGTSATELPTPLGTLLTFERAGMRYLLAGSVTPASIEAFARGL